MAKSTHFFASSAEWNIRMRVPTCTAMQCQLLRTLGGSGSAAGSSHVNSLESVHQKALQARLQRGGSSAILSGLPRVGLKEQRCRGISVSTVHCKPEDRVASSTP